MEASTLLRGSTSVPNDIPRFVTYTSPVSQYPSVPATNGFSGGAATLPLNLVGLILSHLDDLGDIARVTRTCRLLYYMTLPQLYAKVSLHSYPTIRYTNGRPEGFGSASPFLMALNGLVTKAHAGIVQDFRVYGEWNEVGAEDFAKGRVPDNSMMLNILMRSATDRMTKLRSFSWELDCKPLKPLYQGLGSHSNLTSLSIRFPQTRVPRPSVVIPPMANLRIFRAMEIDPLCYPDDISVLLLSSKKLEDVRLHFSPRMRAEAESSLSWATYFGRVLRAEYHMGLKHFAVQNFYGRNVEGMGDILNYDTCKSVTFLDVFGGARGASANVFLDDTWKQIPPDLTTKFTTMRTNEPAMQHVEMLLRAEAPLENLYIVSQRLGKTGNTPGSGQEMPVTPDDSQPDFEATALGKQYLHAITRCHGSSMKHLLLWDVWHLTQDDLGELIRYCPNLEQLGVGVSSEDSLKTIWLLLPFLHKLKALRLLLPNEVEGQCQNSGHYNNMAQTLGKLNAQNLKWLGVGNMIFKIGPRYDDIDVGGHVVAKVHITEVKIADVQHVEIWGRDCLDIMADPVAPFSP
ncbi:uncharacterized protein LTR77_007400 [Saxophila tyrrhenica]|uniref:F-box domain-containing protein n=1 Tax=Saxophila tyrrhenica TaxID=1690608 RepID=A0AAV9P4N8_9PEZI|nr:hypothetical protein LTR77_007400 [Saxophila tyrrhenica]